MSPIAECAALKAQIESAFKDVVREEGISLRESRVIDDHGSAEERAAARRQDSDMRWQDVPAALIEAIPQPFWFLDAKGMRYYLPAYMIWALEQPDPFSAACWLIFALRIQSARERELFALLTEAQSAAVCRFLQYMDRRAAEDAELYETDAKEALDLYWHRFFPA